MQNTSRVLIGSGSECMLQLEGEGIERNHAVIYGVYEGKRTYAYIDSLQGKVSINGSPPQIVKEVKLMDGDTITIGNTKLRITYLPDPDLTDDVTPFQITVLD